MGDLNNLPKKSKFSRDDVASALHDLIKLHRNVSSVAFVKTYRQGLSLIVATDDGDLTEIDLGPRVPYISKVSNLEEYLKQTLTRKIRRMSKLNDKQYHGF